jgi:adenine-specific DNA-methyltransferase
MPARLADYGYRVATGQLVWNRHKTQFRDRPGTDCYPVLWAECIQPDGSFEFRAKNRNHRPFLHVEAAQGFLINQEPCVLVQRTTSKEQTRRLIAATIPNAFIVEQPGYVVENHVNMLVPTRARPAVSLNLLTRLLNSSPVDHAFRCISGSVAVSAYELESLPLPDADKLMRQVPFSRTTVPSAAFEETIRLLYHDA